MTSCAKCGQVFADEKALNDHRHRGCDWTKTVHPNGSYVMLNDRTRTGWLVAPNQFGGTWQMNLSNRINGAGGNPDAQGIHRRGRKWYPQCVNGIGWQWV